MSDMSGALQNRISPPVPKYTTTEFSDAKVDDQVGKQKGDVKKTDFKDLISNSMDEVYKQRDAKKAGDLSAETDEEFFEKLAEQTKEKREPKKELGKDDFLQLFVAQLQNQDPLNPDDGTEMASKLAQFNGLEQMMNMNSTMGQMVKAQNVGRNLQMVNYVGKEIAIDGGRLKLDEGELSNSDFDISVPVTQATLTIRDSSGMTVSEKEIGPLDKGVHKLDWDGKNTAGNELNSGLYSYSIYAKSVEGEKVPVNITSRTIISGVDVQSQNGDLFTDLGKVKLENIKSVGEAGYSNERPAEKAKAAVNDEAAIQNFIDRKKEKGLDTKSTEEQLKKLSGEAVAAATGNKKDSKAEKTASEQKPASPIGEVKSVSKVSTSKTPANNEILVAEERAKAEKQVESESKDDEEKSTDKKVASN